VDRDDVEVHAWLPLIHGFFRSLFLFGRFRLALSAPSCYHRAWEQQRGRSSLVPFKGLRPLFPPFPLNLWRMKTGVPVPTEKSIRAKDRDG
jgi:hypothetical protein